MVVESVSLQMIRMCHSMVRVRGRWPLRDDRPISSPIDWQIWIHPKDHAHEDHGANDGVDNDPAKSDNLLSNAMQVPSVTSTRNTNIVHQHPNDENSIPVSAPTRRHPLTFTPTNPFANPAELQAMKRSFVEQPNWKAAMVEGESWEGSAEENIAKWRGLVGESSSS
jgi:hypothetical protein